MTILVTGGAGFIGSHLVDRLLEQDHTVITVDNFDPFYDRRIKERNIEAHRVHPGYMLKELDIRGLNALNEQIDQPVDCIVHLAAKADVGPPLMTRWSIGKLQAGNPRRCLSQCFKNRRLVRSKPESQVAIHKEIIHWNDKN